uniref:Secreted protein n=1 Tax=Pediastrum duplex TaxID=3105 RepID=A0A2U8GI80_PEDDU|nr:hypothetical protein [Pediastrum duplex]
MCHCLFILHAALAPFTSSTLITHLHFLVPLNLCSFAEKSLRFGCASSFRRRFALVRFGGADAKSFRFGSSALHIGSAEANQRSKEPLLCIGSFREAKEAHQIATQK